MVDDSVKRSPGRIRTIHGRRDRREPAPGIVDCELLRTQGNQIHGDHANVDAVIAILRVNEIAQSIAHISLASLTVARRRARPPQPGPGQIAGSRESTSGRGGVPCFDLERDERVVHDCEHVKILTAVLAGKASITQADNRRALVLE